MTVQVFDIPEIDERTVEKCQRYQNAFIVLWLKQGEDFNDFGDRHCPFCGLQTEVFFIPINE